MGEQLIITFGRPRGGREGGRSYLPGEGGCGLGRVGVLRTLAVDVCGCVEHRKEFQGGTYASGPPDIRYASKKLYIPLC